jgi:8-oxo-dGTP pyrophosphatase MutT (NUDIX family)
VRTAVRDGVEQWRIGRVVTARRWAEGGSMEQVPRRSARVAFIDPDDRVLLQLVADEAKGTTFWLTTGGGMDPGEGVVEAVVREAREETGFVLSPELVGQPVALIDSVWSFRGVEYAGIETLFFVRVPHFEIDPSGQDEIERAIILGWRWWSVDELVRTSERVEPTEMAALAAEYLRSGTPPSPSLLVSRPPAASPEQSARQ